MHHSSLATITQKGIRFSSDLLTPLSIREGTPVWAAYYPTPQEYGFDESYHDLMITPVPYECWLFSGRFRIWFQQQKAGGLSKLARVFKKNGMSIICSEASRSGHRYATCTVTVCVDSIMCQYDNHRTNLTLDIIENIKTQVSNKIECCVRDIENQCQDFHFSDSDALGLEKPVMGERLDALSYFYERMFKVRRGNDIHSQPWRFICKGGSLHPKEKTKSFMKIAIKGALPSRAFAEINTREANLRLAIIPKKQLQYFGWVIVDYQWQDTTSLGDNTDSCDLSTLSRNVISDITGIISKEHNIWRCFSYAILRERYHEEGRIEFFLRLLDRESDFTKQWNRLEDQLKSASLDTLGAKITEASVTPISFKRIFISTRTNLPRKDVLLRACEEAGSQYGMLSQDFRTVSTYVNRVTETIVKEIKGSHAMIQYYGNIENDPDNYDWLHAELLAAHVLGMPVVAIVEGNTPREKIRTLGDKTPIKISNDPSEDEILNAVKTALDEINNTKFEA